MNHGPQTQHPQVSVSTGYQEISLCTTVGLKNSDDSKALVSIYPNPAGDNLIIEVPQQEVINIQTIQGQLIKSLVTSGNKTNIDISEFPDGMYILELKTERGFTVKKFVKE